jgi:1-acyl-sn-glycerol-3-phosphate acyltransferase
MRDRTYHWITRIINLCYWRGTLLGGENLPAHGPAVLVANHLGPAGPVDTACSIPLRMYPWIIADMVDREKAPDYLRIDFVESSLKLKQPASKMVAKAITLISVPLLASLGCIPVTRGHTQELTISVDVLKEGKVVLVFPEEPEAELNPVTQMRPFLKGFTRLGELYYDETGEKLRFYPVAVHGSRRVIREMYLELDC